MTRDLAGELLPVHPFPARMASDIALRMLSRQRVPLRILDPMVGSGTVLAAARTHGHRAVGLDLDPLAVLMSRVWVTTVDEEAIRASADRVLTRARRIFRTMSVARASPRNCDQETHRFVVYWFDGYARRQLRSLADAIEGVHDERVRDVLWCALSRLIITKQAGASLAMDLSHSRPHKRFRTAPAKPFRKFALAVDAVLSRCISKKGAVQGPAPRVHRADARAIPLARESIDLVLTSPPYLNAIDYLRCSKFTLVWMGFTIAELRQLRSQSVGSEAGMQYADEFAASVVKTLDLTPKLPARAESVLIRYICDMRAAVGEVSRVLKRGGRAIYIVGDNTIRGTLVRNSKILRSVAEVSGLRLDQVQTRNLRGNRRYLPPPSLRHAEGARLNGRMRREIILTFTKPPTS